MSHPRIYSVLRRISANDATMKQNLFALQTIHLQVSKFPQHTRYLKHPLSLPPTPKKHHIITQTIKTSTLEEKEKKVSNKHFIKHPVPAHPIPFHLSHPPTLRLGKGRATQSKKKRERKAESYTYNIRI